MESFQKIVLIAAIIILILCLIFIGISLSQPSQQPWPPLIPACPDYWELSGSNNNIVCKNVQHLGNSTTPNTIKLDDANFATNCSKYTWAKSKNITWDGITYGVSNPCINT